VLPEKNLRALARKIRQKNTIIWAEKRRGFSQWLPGGVAGGKISSVFEDVLNF
jgi:hypothetical protein